MRGVDVSAFDFSFAGETDRVLVSTLYKTNKEALGFWVTPASCGNINILLKYPALCLFPPHKMRE